MQPDTNSDDTSNSSLFDLDLEIHADVRGIGDDKAISDHGTNSTCGSCGPTNSTCGQSC